MVSLEELRYTEVSQGIINKDAGKQELAVSPGTKIFTLEPLVSKSTNFGLKDE